MPKLRIYIISTIVVLLLCPVSLYAGSVYVTDQTGASVQPTLPPKTVVLTFDDGPSQYTTRILEVLNEKNVKATFFVVGQQVIGHKLLKEIYDGGHEIGNHTFSHNDLSKMPEWRVGWELGLNRLIIESQIKHSTRLFRPPYLGSDNLSAQPRSVIDQVGRQGYVTVGEDLDSEDWRRPGVDRIIANATDQSRGGIILMHDGGGQRGQTVQALPAIIDYYQVRGFRFTTLGGALGLSRDQLMPKLSTGDAYLSALCGLLLVIISLLATILHLVIIFLIVACFGRMILVVTAARLQAQRPQQRASAHDIPVSIIVPAYNESAVILSCLNSILASNYQAFEIIVIDDGSSDDTVRLANRYMGSHFKVVSKVNGGKASALNHGIALARTNYIIAIDADTVFRADTITQLMRHFQDPKVGAVSGNTRIANRHTLLTKLQSLEYIVGFNLDRRMGDLFDCITVVPGAIGAFRKSVLQAAGGFTHDTLAEDTDVTLTIKEVGHRIVYDASALAYTEAPVTVRDLLKQRFRWTYGTMQAVWKHRGSFFNPKYGTLGMIGLPYLVFYQILFPLLSPLFDVAVIGGILSQQYRLVLISFVVYTVADLIMSGIALKLDGEKLSQLWLIVPQRLIYRQLMYYVIIKSLVNVLRGSLVGWGSLRREGKHLDAV